MHSKGSPENHRTRFLLHCAYSSSQLRGKKMPPVRQHTPCYLTSDVYRIQTGKYMGLQKSVMSYCSLQYTSASFMTTCRYSIRKKVNDCEEKYIVRCHIIYSHHHNATGKLQRHFFSNLNDKCRPDASVNFYYTF